MSVKALSWAFHESESTNTARLVLLSLADSVNDLGECWLGYASIARKSRVSESTARRACRQLEEMGELEIILGGGAAAAERAGKMPPRADRVTNCFRMTFTTACHSDTPPDGVDGVSRGSTRDGPSKRHGVSNTTPRGVTAMTPEPLLTHSISKSTELLKNGSGQDSFSQSDEDDTTTPWRFDRTHFSKARTALTGKPAT